MDFESYAAFFALSLQNRADIGHRVVENAELKSSKEAKRVAKEFDPLEKSKAKQALLKRTAAKLQEHRLPQQSERVECQVLRVGQECGPPWPTDAEVREILRNDPRARSTLCGTHYAIPVTNKEMVSTPVLLAESPADTPKVELRDHNPFALRSMFTSIATLPTQGQAGYQEEGDSPRAAGSLLKDTRRARQMWEGQVSAKTEPAESAMNERSEAMPKGVQVD